MDIQKLKKLIEQGEGQNVEFKESALTQTLGATICAFANANGGLIIIGVDDEGMIKGCELDNSTRSKIQNIAHSAEPSINIDLKQVDNLWIVRVDEQKDKPSRDVGDRVATLQNLKLITEAGQMTNAGAWLLAHRISKFNISATITCAKFFGTEKDEILDCRDFDADINSMLASAEDWIKSNINIRYDTSQFKRKEIPELPMDALREAVVNALAHRDYRATPSIKIYLFHDRLEIVSPGGLPKGVDKSNFGKKSAPRNPLLFEIMQRMQLVEKVGYGITKMYDACKEQGLPEPRFHFEDEWVTVTFARVPAETPDKPSAESLRTRVIILLSQSRRRPLSRSEIAEGLGQKGTSSHLRNVLKELITSGLVAYTIPENPNNRNQRYRLTRKGKS